MKYDKAWKTFRLIWNYVSQVLGVMSMINILDDAIKWKGIILDFALAYQALIYPIFNVIRYIIHIDVPYWLMNYLLIGMIITKSFWSATFTTSYSKQLMIKYAADLSFFDKMKFVFIVGLITAPIWPIWLLGLFANLEPYDAKGVEIQIDLVSKRALSYIGIVMVTVLILVGINVFL